MTSEVLDEKEIVENRKKRAKLMQEGLLKKQHRSSKDLKARKEYWYKQMHFLYLLFKKNSELKGGHSLEVVTEEVPMDPTAFLKNRIADCLHSESQLEILVNFILKEYQGRAHEGAAIKEMKDDESKHVTDGSSLTLPEGKQSPKPIFSQGEVVKKDVITVLDELIKQEYLPVVNNAANSQRDGSSKYKKGSLEEIIARHTDSMLAMMTHFSVEGNPFSPETRHFQKCYLRLCLSIMQQIISADNPDAYLVSNEFLKHLLTGEKVSFDDKGTDLAIYFALQNFAYEVPPESGLASVCRFAPGQYSTFTQFSAAMNVEEVSLDAFPRAMVISAAAPDRRRLESLDAGATRNKLLQKPHEDKTLQTMITGGVHYQCKQALALKKNSPSSSPYIVFLLPGCGVFGNPLGRTAQLFVKAIEENMALLAEADIPFCIVEKNLENAVAISKAWNHRKKNPQEITSKEVISKEAIVKSAKNMAIAGFFGGIGLGTGSALGVSVAVDGVKSVDFSDLSSTLHSLGIAAGIGLLVGIIMMVLIYFFKKRTQPTNIESAPLVVTSSIEANS